MTATKAEEFLTLRQFYDRLSSFPRDATTKLGLQPRKVDYECGGYRGVSICEDWNVIDVEYGNDDRKVGDILDVLAPYMEKNGKLPVTFCLDVITTFSINLHMSMKCDITPGKDVKRIPSLNPYYEPSPGEVEPQLKAILLERPSDKFVEVWCKQQNIRQPYFQFYYVGKDCYTTTELKQEFTDLAKEADWQKLFDSRQVGPVTLFECKFSAARMQSEFCSMTRIEKMLQQR